MFITTTMAIFESKNHYSTMKFIGKVDKATKNKKKFTGDLRRIVKVYSIENFQY